MIDLPYSSRCRMADCPARAVRNALCLQHLQELVGTDRLPWPTDIEPRGHRERAYAQGRVPADN